MSIASEAQSKTEEIPKLIKLIKEVLILGNLLVNLEILYSLSPLVTQQRLEIYFQQ